MTTDISVGVRWDPLNGQPDGNNGQIEDYDFEYDGGNSSSRLFERSRIRALAGEFIQSIFYKNSMNVVAYEKVKSQTDCQFSTVFVIFEYGGDKKITQIQFCGDAAYLRERVIQ